VSQADVDTVLAAFAAFNRGDYDSWIAAFDGDAEVHDLAETPDTAVFRGHDGVRAWLAKLQEAWGAEFRFEPRSFNEADGVVLVDTLAVATGTESGVAVEMPVHLVLRLRNHKVVWTQGFLDRANALEAAGRQD
jgi:ketosteroid isomerase-like protein